MDRISDGIWNLDAQPFGIQTNGCHFVKYHLKSGQKCPDFKWSSIQMVRTIAISKVLHNCIFSCFRFENLTVWNPIFNKTSFQMLLDFEWSDLALSTTYSSVKPYHVTKLKKLTPVDSRCVVMKTNFALPMWARTANSVRLIVEVWKKQISN